MDILNTLNQAANYLGATANSDEVFIMDGESFVNVFTQSRPITIDVREPSKIMTHPLETGATITDHMIIEPVVIEINSIFINDYGSTLEQLKSAFDAGKLYAIQTKGKLYPDMVLADLPHQEDPEFMNVLMSTLRFQEVVFVTPEYGELPEDQVTDTKDTSTVKRGTQQTTETTEATAAKAEDTYKGSVAVGWIYGGESTYNKSTP